MSHEGAAALGRATRNHGVKKPAAKGPPRSRPPLGNVDTNTRSQLPLYPTKRGTGAAAKETSSKSGTSHRRPTMVEKANENANRRATGGGMGRTRQQKVVNFTSNPTGGASKARRAKSQQDEPVDQAELEALRKRAESQDEIVGQITELRDVVLKDKAGEISRMEVLVSKVGTLEARLAQSETDRAEKVEALGKASIALASEEQARKNDHALQEAKLSEVSSQTSTLQHELNTLKTTMSAIETDKKFLESSLCEKKDELEKLRMAHGDNDKVVEKLKSEKEELSTAVERGSHAIANLERNVESGNVRLRDLRQEVCNLEMASVEKQTELRKLHVLHDSLKEEMERATSSLSAERAHVDRLKQDLRGAQEEAGEQRRKFECEIANFQKESGDQEKKLQEKLSSLEVEKRKAEASLKDTDVELGAAKSDLAQFRATITSQEGALSSTQSQIHAMQVKLTAQADLCAQRDSEVTQLNESMAKQSQKIVELEEQAQLDEDERRRLHNALQELKGNIRVFCRVRPLLKHEDDPSGPEVFSYTNKARGIVAANPASQQSKTFTFDRVFGPDSTQEDVFREISQLVQSALDGYRVCIFAYGQTGSGKTHTIMGSEADRGMIPRSVQQLFDRADRMKRDSWDFKFQASFLEIYNEEIRDLLVAPVKGQGANGVGKPGKGKGFQITYTAGAENMCSIDGLTVARIDSPAEAAALITKAAKNRATAATRSNAESSRSHSIFRLYINAKNASTGQSLRGLLNLVDLAGSERVKVSGAEGVRLRETQNINKSLTQLGVVIQSLANKAAHVPFRSSTLTKVLQDSLGGDSKALMFVNVAPAPASYSESNCALTFAERVNACDIGVAKRAANINLTEGL